MALLEVRDLKTQFRTDDGIVGAVDGVSFSVDPGKTLAIVGESGCGKSVTCLTILGLNPRAKTISTGEAIFKGRNLLELPPTELRKVRGNEISMIFQDPMTSLNPVHSIGKQLREAIQLHNNESKATASKRNTGDSAVSYPLARKAEAVALLSGAGRVTSTATPTPRRTA